MSAFFTLGAAMIGFAQTDPVPPIVTAPGSIETGEPGANLPSATPSVPDPGAQATGATPKAGASSEPTSAESTNRGSMDSTSTQGARTATGEGTGGKTASGSARGTTRSSNIDPTRSDKAARRARSPAVASSGKAPQAGSMGRAGGRSGVAAQMPAPPSDEQASADQYLRDAQTALRNRRTGEALEALERAETRVLGGAMGQGTPSGESQDRAVAAIERAREALGHRRYLRPNTSHAGQMIDQALAQNTGSNTASDSGGSQLVP